MADMRVIVVGASGRMGRMLVSAISDAKGAVLAGATERTGSAFVGRDAGELAGIETLGVNIVDDINSCSEADVIIDFTAPAATLSHAAFAASHDMGMVIGTTGFEAAQMDELRDILSGSPVVMAANYSVGVNLALSLIERAAEVLGDDYDAEIFEAHHRHKVDAPSGTALAMGRALAVGRCVSLDDTAVYSREGITGARKPGSIGFSVVRGGNIVGEHQAMFIADEERIEINHVASDRMVFAKGAVRAGSWLMAKDAGWYDMQDVLNLRD
ncbi:dihydrodipicolinate reductase [Mariprofundus aestuarium]|uniref:4-hydroxy-tetrahydrodipicolinate reductase n=1 Tax=Mariprofundus aestuarium TaxID=1921086 RepID=A0A2K8L2R0_MARES|nr:dihydrodipicolinate reductase [Mariprofundus aestuarium]